MHSAFPLSAHVHLRVGFILRFSSNESVKHAGVRDSYFVLSVCVLILALSLLLLPLLVAAAHSRSVDRLLSAISRYSPVGVDAEYDLSPLIIRTSACRLNIAIAGITVNPSRVLILLLFYAAVYSFEYIYRQEIANDDDVV